MCSLCFPRSFYEAKPSDLYLDQEFNFLSENIFMEFRGYKCKKEARYMGGLFHRTLNKEPLVWRDWPICFQLSLCSINEYLPYVADFYFYCMLCILY